MTHTITDEQLDEIEAELDLWDREVRRDYSGRGMYGRQCLGFVGDSVGQFAAFADAVAAAIDVDPYELMDRASTDSMGLSTIWYWRSVQVEGHEGEERP